MRFAPIYRISEKVFVSPQRYPLRTVQISKIMMWNMPLLSYQHHPHLQKKGRTPTGSSSYTAFSIYFICSNMPSAANVTLSPFFPFFFSPPNTSVVSVTDTATAVIAVALVDATGSTAGDAFRALFITLNASWNASIELGCATFVSTIIGFTSSPTPAPPPALVLLPALPDVDGVEDGRFFLKLGNFGFGFGALKKLESDFASLTVAPLIDDEAAAESTVDGVEVMPSFFTGTGLDDGVADIAAFFNGGAAFGTSPSFLFFAFGTSIE